MLVILYIIPPLLIVIYKILDYSGIIDKLTKRNYAVKGYERLKSTAGSPTSWIYNDQKDKYEFNALFTRIKRKTKSEKLKDVFKEGHIPSLITTGGNPILFGGIPPEWEQHEKSFYSSSHPILVLFGVTREDGGKGKSGKACTLGELEKWINEEKKMMEFWLGVVVISLFSIISIILRLIL